MAKQVRTRSREDQEARRAQIIDEAIRIVGERGFFGFTVQDLAQRCGISNAGLLYHFSTKDELLHCMLQEFEARESAAMEPLVALTAQDLRRTKADATAVVELLRTMVARASTQPEMSRLYMVLQSEALDPDHPAYESFRVREAKTLNLFVNLATPFSDEPRSAARQLIALMDGLSQQWVRENQGFDLMREWDQAVGSILPPLRKHLAAK